MREKRKSALQQINTIKELGATIKGMMEESAANHAVVSERVSEQARRQEKQRGTDIVVASEINRKVTMHVMAREQQISGTYKGNDWIAGDQLLDRQEQVMGWIAFIWASLHASSILPRTPYVIPAMRKANWRKANWCLTLVTSSLSSSRSKRSCTTQRLRSRQLC